MASIRFNVVILSIVICVVTEAANERFTPTPSPTPKPKSATLLLKRRELCFVDDCVRKFKGNIMAIHFFSRAPNVTISFDDIHLIAICKNMTVNICHFPLWNLKNYANGVCSFLGNSTHGYTMSVDNGLQYKNCQINASFVPTRYCMELTGIPTTFPLVTVEVKDAEGKTTLAASTRQSTNVTTTAKATDNGHVTTLTSSGAVDRINHTSLLVMLVCLGLHTYRL